MFETFLKMQIILQKPFSKAVSFESHLTLLVFTALDRTQKQPEGD
jgi:hypothetical protein